MNGAADQPYVDRITTAVTAGSFVAGAVAGSVAFGAGVVPAIGVAMIAGCAGICLGKILTHVCLAEREISALDHSIKIIFNRALTNREIGRKQASDFIHGNDQHKLMAIDTIISCYEMIPGQMSCIADLQQKINSIRQNPDYVKKHCKPKKLLNKLATEIAEKHKLALGIHFNQKNLNEELNECKVRLEKLKKSIHDLYDHWEFYTQS